MDLLSNAQCKHLVSPGYINFTLSILIVFGILLSYLPQHYRIISLKSSYGISPYFVLLGTISGSSSLANVVSQQQSLQDVSCCSDVNGLACFAGLLGILQIGTQCLCFFIILFLYIIYFPRDVQSSPSTTKPRPQGPTYRTALIVGAVCILHISVMLIATITIGLKRPGSLQSWSNFCGILAAVLSSIQYFPQIYTTVKLRCVGSLSIPMMCIQTPGGFVWAASLAARLGAKGWSTWGVLLITATLQGLLLVLSVFFEYLGPNKGHSHGEDGSVENDERDEQESRPSEETPLLQNQ
ncbi:hypothetical protein BDV27DRAFT_37371 [Aspergillus caelatus]|uniref:PQ loop repeat-domain-containing protein n=2 Tax=Aspergillus subgen. Circumdati TaxID=2720871 RepID=A0A5N6ZST9_9EURO|nr:uncharacterized protein BDV27DRAFT_37371 [Aspergillus caelatus]KAE8360661.1 hypothetical protein BDV27DRAFT_37371 [Aspergillus caelatus]KAE8412866.1 hypothetical protein BDV36DRAFT_46736 [Aspergillus pseudocaelatus]